MLDAEKARLSSLPTYTSVRLSPLERSLVTVKCVQIHVWGRREEREREGGGGGRERAEREREGGGREREREREREVCCELSSYMLVHVRVFQRIYPCCD